MVEKITLPNGVRIVWEEIPGVRSVSVGIWVQVGSRDESSEVNGISHFIEHMMFKGTKNRTAKQLAEALDAVGGQLNAFTSKEYTCYYAKVLDEHSDLAVDVLSDMFFNSLFAENEINKEKNVVLEEIKMYEDSPDDLVHDMFTATLLKGHRLEQPIIGTKEVINGMNSQKVREYFNQHYVPENIVVAIAGNLRGTRLIERLKNIFGNWTGDKKTDRKLMEIRNNTEVVSKTKDIEQVHLCLGCLSLPIEHEDTYVLHCLNSILGGGISSRLFQNIREERGLAYSVYSYTSAYQDTGSFAIYGGLSKTNIPEYLDLVNEELANLVQKAVSQEELVRAREQLKGNLFLGLESVSSRMSRLGKGELCLNKILSPEEIADKINQVEVEQIGRLAGQLLNRKNVIISAIGPAGTREAVDKWLQAGKLGI